VLLDFVFSSFQPSMRPLDHPSLKCITLEGIMNALSDPVRASIYLAIKASPSPVKAAVLLGAHGAPIAKASLSQHLKVLRQAGLIRGVRSGAALLSSSRHVEVEKRFPDLVQAIVKGFKIQSNGKRE
jgi:hypothetical protein